MSYKVTGALLSSRKYHQKKERESKEGKKERKRERKRERKKEKRKRKEKRTEEKRKEKKRKKEKGLFWPTLHWNIQGKAMISVVQPSEVDTLQSDHRIL